jgi:hypothetical protein
VANTTAISDTAHRKIETDPRMTAASDPRGRAVSSRRARRDADAPATMAITATAKAKPTR